MHLTLTPQSGLSEMTIHVDGDTITLDGIAYDLSACPDGGTMDPPEGAPIIAPVHRIDGVLHVTVIARIGPNAALQQGGPWVVENATGDVAIPYARISEATE